MANVLVRDEILRLLKEAGDEGLSIANLTLGIPKNPYSSGVIGCVADGLKNDGLITFAPDKFLAYADPTTVCKLVIT